MRFPKRFLAIASGCMLAAAANADEPAAKPVDPPVAKESVESELTPLSEEGQRLADELKEKLSEGTEARAMLDALLAGSELGSEDGWFPTAIAQTRFTWDALAAKYDSDHDGKIVRGEFPGPDDEFKRLDRDHSEAINKEDLEWKEDALFRSPLTDLFFRTDADSNGAVTREEFAAVFDRLDREGLGELSLDDLKLAVSPPPGGPSPDDPTREMLLRAFSKQELGAFNPGPSVGDKAIDFTLKTADNLQDIRLSEQYREKPLVLVFGNFTCGPFRAHSGNAERVYRLYHDRANFLMVYVREAHPKEGWKLRMNTRYEIEIPQPATQEERVLVAQRCQKHIAAPWPMVVDRLDDEVGKAYSGMPSRLYLIDTDGTVVYKSGRGPFGFKPAELEQSLVWLLTEKMATPVSENPAAKENAAQ